MKPTTLLKLAALIALALYFSACAKTTTPELATITISQPDLVDPIAPVAPIEQPLEPTPAIPEHLKLWVGTWRGIEDTNQYFTVYPDGTIEANGGVILINNGFSITPVIKSSAMINMVTQESTKLFRMDLINRACFKTPAMNGIILGCLSDANDFNATTTKIRITLEEDFFIADGFGYYGPQMNVSIRVHFRKVQ